MRNAECRMRNHFPKERTNVREFEAKCGMRSHLNLEVRSANFEGTKSAKGQISVARYRPIAAR